MAPLFMYNDRFQRGARGLAPNSTEHGCLLQAAGMPLHTLYRRKFAEPYQQFRMLDPQMYLATLDAATPGNTVATLATYPWFGGAYSAGYDSGESTQRDWLASNRPALVKGWRGAAPTSAKGIYASVHSALAIQIQLDCACLIAPLPLRVNLSRVGDMEAQWWDAAIAAQRALRDARPLLLTLAISDPLLRDQAPATNPLVQQLLTEISARRSDVAGVFLVLNQATADEYTVSDGSIAESLLHIVAALALRANMAVFVGYQGVVGCALVAAGAVSWSTGYYKRLRRLRLADYGPEPGGRVRPRFLSALLAGDVGVEHGIDAAWRAGNRAVVTDTAASKPLLAALGRGSGAVSPQWAYTPGNITAAWGHYCLVLDRIVREMTIRPPADRVEYCSEWLSRAADQVERLRGLDGFDTSASETLHQRAWSRAFDKWRNAFFS